MDLISSRYRKPKGRPKKSRQVKSENAKKRWAKKSLDSEQSIISSPNATNSNELDKMNSVSTNVDTNYIIMCKTLWSSLLKNIPCHECKGKTLQVSQTNSFGFSSKIFLSCASCKKEFGSVFTSEREVEDKTFHVNNHETTITKLQNYYRKAVKDNAPDVNKMKKSIFASLYHCMSTDSKPQHSKCPVGAESWCFFQRAIAQGETPKSHKKMKTTLSELVVEKILPVYQRLASDEMLSKCISAKTQNANESLHSCIWRKCPK
ncbi:hypothetical protein AVEN_263567-1 [Araneus ventricosus]|uniref:Mutator-like transposase domain-containing protein n=1 Tax=Araneus ventricosus TaxID=182803 RepID=A0A4Y2HU28_ARAVE|nr:hypothetical protein AVEN_263567-1 [Araneus ventricosus]